MYRRLLDVLRAKFLVSEQAPRNWRLLIFFALLGALDITSSHVADWQVHRREELEEEVLWLKNELVMSRQQLQQLTMESYLEETLGDKGLKRPDTVIRKLIVQNNPSWQPANRN